MNWCRDTAYLFGGVKYHADYDFTSVWQLKSDASEWTQYKEGFRIHHYCFFYTGPNWFEKFCWLSYNIGPLTGSVMKVLIP